MLLISNAKCFSVYCEKVKDDKAAVGMKFTKILLKNGNVFKKKRYTRAYPATTLRSIMILTFVRITVFQNPHNPPSMRTAQSNGVQFGYREKSASFKRRLFEKRFRTIFMNRRMRLVKNLCISCICNAAFGTEDFLQIRE